MLNTKLSPQNTSFSPPLNQHSIKISLTVVIVLHATQTGGSSFFQRNEWDNMNNQHAVYLEQCLLSLCSQVHGYSFWPGYYSHISMILKKIAFWSATDVMSNYLNPLTETVFFSACCVVTHSVVCTLWIIVGNTRQCLLNIFICCVLQK